MPALEVISGRATAPSTTATALTMATGDSLTVRNAPKPVWLLSAWADWQTAGVLRIRSPRMHDAVQGIRLQGVASEVQPLIYPPAIQALVPQDTLTVDITGSGTAGDFENAALLLYYEQLPGADARLITYNQLMSRLVNIVTVENSITTAAGGGWTGEEAINAEFDLLKANTEYAILGYNVSAECCAVGWRGPDFGGLRLGGPGSETDKATTSEWFAELSRLTGKPMIPVFNSANKAGTFVAAVQDENATAVVLTTILAQLR